MHKVPVVSLVSLKKRHPEVVGSLKPVDSGKYTNSGAGNYIEVPDNVAGVYFSRGRDSTGNYYRFLYLPTAPSPLPTVAATKEWEYAPEEAPDEFDLLKYEYRVVTFKEMKHIAIDEGVLSGGDAIGKMHITVPWFGHDPKDNTYCLALRPGNPRYYLQWVKEDVLGLSLSDCIDKIDAETKVQTVAGFGSTPLGAYMRKEKS